MYLLLIIFGITYILIATEKVDKSVAATLGAAAMILTGRISCEEAFQTIDLNVLGLLIGMMMIVSVFGRTGVFEWLAVTIAQKAKGNGMAILLLFLVTTAVFSALLDNVTCVILIAPLTILICQILELPVVPFLITEAIFSNIGGTATLVGDPPNILIGSSADLSFNDFIYHLGPIVVVITAVSLTIIYIMMKPRTSVTARARARIMDADPHRAILEPQTLYAALTVFAIVLVGFVLARFLEVEPGIIALGGGFLAVMACRSDVHKTLEKVEWSTVLFFAGLFMLVGALEVNGVFEWLGTHVISLTRGNVMLTAIAILWLSGLVSSIVDNIPLVIAMIPLIHSLVPRFADDMGLAITDSTLQSQVVHPLFWALALGACLGGNGTLIGASANVVISQVARKNKYRITYWTYTAYGFPLMILSLVLSSLYIWIRYFLLTPGIAQ